MKNLKNLVAVFTLITVLVIGTTNTYAGLLVSDFTGGDSQTTCTETETKPDWGIVITSATGIVITSFTGIVITHFSDTEQTNCGILMTD